MEKKHFKNTTVYYILFALICVLLIILAEYLGFLDGINNYAYDLSFRIRGNKQHSENIVIVAIDEKTLGRFGKWPIRRINYAKLLDKISKSRIVLIDVVMAEPSHDDTVLANTIKKYGNVILPAYIDGQSKQIISSQPLDALGIGHVHIEEEIDGVVRKIYHTMYFKNITLPSITSVGCEAYKGKAFTHNSNAPALHTDSSSENIIQADFLKINYYGGPETFPLISMTDIIDGKYPMEFFRDKIVLVGVTAIGIEGRILTPFSEKRNRMTGVEAHANILNNLLDNDSIRDVNKVVQGLSCIMLAASFFFLLLKLGEKKATLLWLFSLVVLTFSAFILFALFNKWINPAPFYLSLTSVFFITYMLRLDEAAHRLDLGYSAIASISGWEARIIEKKAPQNGLLSLLSPAGVNSKIELLRGITDQLKDAYVQISKDLEAAAQMQKELLPSSSLSIPGMEFEWFFYPSRFVAGDIFNCFQIDETHIEFYLADVSGHGVPAAMLANTISKILMPSQSARNHLFSASSDSSEIEITSPAKVLKEINRFFSSTGKSDQYFTAVYGIIDTLQHTITIAQAGLPQPIFLKSNGDILTIGQGGFPIALMDDIEYTDEVISYSRGDRFFLYSDGITECFNKDEEQFSTIRLLTALQEGRKVPLKASLKELEEALFAWRGTAEFDDDLTMLAIELE